MLPSHSSIYRIILSSLLIYKALLTILLLGRPDGKESACNAGNLGSDPRVRKIPWRMEWQPNPVFLPGELHGQTSLAGYSPWGHKELDTTGWITLSLFICLPPGGSDGKESAHNVGVLGSTPGLGRSLGEGYGNPFQYSCLTL